MKGADYDSIYGAVSKKVGELAMPAAIGMLKALMDKANTPDRHNQVYEILLKCIMSGAFSYAASKGQRETLTAAARTIGFPLAYYISDLNGQTKVARLLDIAAQSKGLTKPTEASGRKSANFTADNFTANFKDFREKFEKRRRIDDQGGKIMDFFALGGLKDNTGIFKVMESDTTSEPDKVLLKDYMAKVNLSDDTVTITDDISQDSYYDRMFLLTPSKVVAAKMLRMNNNNFDERFENQANSFWGKVANNLNTMAVTPSSFDLVMKKYFAWFKQYYNNNAKQEFVEALLWPHDQHDRPIRGPEKAKHIKAVTDWNFTNGRPLALINAVNAFA